jgi:hypothetical protein
LLTIPLLDPTVIDAEFGWRLAFGLGAILGVGVLLVRRHVPESPRWLFIHGRAGGRADRPRSRARRLSGNRNGPAPVSDDRRAGGTRVAGEDRAARDGRVDKHGVGRLPSEGRHQGLILCLRGPGEDVLQVERNRLDALQFRAFRELIEQAPVEVGLGWERDVGGPRRRVLNLEVGRRFLVIDDPGEALDYIVTTQTGVHQRTAGIACALIGGANGDYELDRYLTDLLAGVTSQIRRILSVYRDRRWLRDGVAFEDLVATTAIVGGIDTYLRMTQREGWSVPRYQAWCRRMLAETVFR